MVVIPGRNRALPTAIDPLYTRYARALDGMTPICYYALVRWTYTVYHDTGRIRTGSSYAISYTVPY